MYFIGLFVMTIGIALSVKLNLGVSPVSSIPYTMTCVWGIEMGKATILFHIVLVLIQILLLRRKFKPAQLLQILVGVVFGYFTTFCNYMVSFLPTPDNLGIRIVMVLASTVFVAAVVGRHLRSGSHGPDVVLRMVLHGRRIAQDHLPQRAASVTHPVGVEQHEHRPVAPRHRLERLKGRVGTPRLSLVFGRTPADIPRVAVS